MAVAIIGPKFYAWDRNGKPLAFGKLYTYEARTNIPKPTYQSEDHVVENTNPVILNGEGYADVYLDGAYKIVLKDDKDNEIWSSDPVTSNQADEWIACVSATYISTTSFKVVGNYSDTYTSGRKVRLTDNSNFFYSTIDSSSYAAGETTVILREPIVPTGITKSCASIVSQDSSFNSKDVAQYTDYIFNTVDDMKLSEIAKDARSIRTLGFYEVDDGGGATYKILDSYIPDGFGSHELIGGKFAVITTISGRLSALQFGAKDDGAYDSTQNIQALLNESASRGAAALFNGGDYLVTSTIQIPSNSTIEGTKRATIKRDASYDPMFLNGQLGSTYTQRNANKNILINGINFDLDGQTHGTATCLALGHGEFISITNCEFRNCQNSHHIEINGCRDVNIKGCGFYDMIDTGSRQFSEAIQLDGMFSSDVFPFFGGGSFDNTTCKDINITECNFTDCLVAIGSHTFATYGDGTVNTAHIGVNVDNININNAGAGTSASDGITPKGWFNSNVSNINIDTAGNNGIFAEDSPNLSLSNINCSNVAGNAVFLVRNTWEMGSISVDNIKLRTGLDIVNLFKCSNVSLSNLNGLSGRYGVQLANCDDINLNGLVCESFTKGIQCSKAEAISARLSFSGIGIRSTSDECMFIYASDSSFIGNLASVPAASKSNVILDQSSGVSINGFYLNGASVSETFKLQNGCDRCVIESSRNAGTGTNAVVIDSGVTNTLLQSLFLNGPSSIVDNGTGTIQHNIN